MPVGTVAYGGTYQFAVLNTGAPKEANRDVLELPERFSGDGAGGNTGVVGPGGRGRRITREIEHVICADGGQQALIMCADGGVVFYNSSSEVVGDVVGGSEEESGLENGSGGGGCGGVLLELPALFRVKDQQQHPGSWTLRRIGRQGFVVRV